MKTLSEMYSHYCPSLGKPKNGVFGIEIETEVIDNSDYPSELGLYNENNDDGDEVYRWNHEKVPSWNAVVDHSLRNYGVEWVLKEPLSYGATMGAIDEFSTFFGSTPFIENAPGTSVHVHLNFQNRTPIELANFLTVYFLVENNLVEFAGENRRSNLFALPARCAEMGHQNVLSMIKKIERGDAYALQWGEHTVKYASLNIATLSKYGSIEIRCLRGTTKKDILTTWVDILNGMYEYAQTPLLTPRDIMSLFRDDEEGFLRSIFGGNYDVLFGKPEDDARLNRNLWFAATIASSVRNWDDFGQNVNDPVAATKAKIKKAKKTSFTPTQSLGDALGNTFDIELEGLGS